MPLFLSLTTILFSVFLFDTQLFFMFAENIRRIGSLFEMSADQASQAWVQEFKKLPPERREAIKSWYRVQAYYAQHLGLPLETWMEHVQWAFAHPFDYSFISDFPELAAAIREGDGFERAQSSAALLGKEEHALQVDTGKAKGNSLFDFMLGRGGDASDDTAESQDKHTDS
jgi:hypothetical protein